MMFLAEAVEDRPRATIGAEQAGRLLALVARVCQRSEARVSLDSELGFDLGLDSLGRVELAALIEEQLGTRLPDETIGTASTVGDLLAAIERGEPAAAVEPLPAWPRRAPALLARRLIQEILLFPALRLLCRPRRVEGAAQLRALDGPALIVANHTSHLDAPVILSVLPVDRRRRTAVAAAADYFFVRTPLATASALALGAFPFHRQGAISASLRHCRQLADAGHSIVIFPEGTRSQEGKLQAFKPGIGLLARELGLPVVPIYLDGLDRILPKGRVRPRRGRLTVRIGEPIRIDRGLSNADAAAVLETAVRRLVSSPSPLRR